jgi:predicted metal-dependent hydrolase
MKKRILAEAIAAHQKSVAKPLDKSLEDIVPVQVFYAEVAAWARRIGVYPKQIQLRTMKRKWASCSSRGRLTFDTALLRQPARFRAQVVVHELLHFKVPNHGKLFKTLYRAYVPEDQWGESIDLK